MWDRMSTANPDDMSFLQHLEELRWRLVKSIISILVGAAITFLFIDQIINLLVSPIHKVSTEMNLQVLTVQGMFMVRWGLALVGGGILAIPVLTYQIWRFVAPGLLGKEKKYIIPLIFATFVSFLLGVLFAYLVIIPFSLSFFASLGYGTVENNVSINYYLSFVTWVMVGTGFIFELPVVVFILSSFGLLSPSIMRKFRRHSIVVIMVLSAIITPPDPVSLVIMSIPLMVLYEIGIYVSWLVARSKQANITDAETKKLDK